MSMRISVIEGPVNAKIPVKDMTNNANCIQNYSGCRRSPKPDFYIRSQHISRKPKSPFRKYESCVTESFRTTKYLASTQTTLDCGSSISTSGLFHRSNKIPFDANQNSNQDDYKIVNKFEDLVIACVDNTSPCDKPICYKKRYLVNRPDSNRHLGNSQVQDNIIPNQSDFIHVDENKHVKSEDKIIKIEIVNSKPQATSQVYTEKEVSPYYTVRDCLLCANCKAKLENKKATKALALTPSMQRKNVHFNTDSCESTSKEVVTKQPPLGVPDHSDDANSKTDGLQNCDEIELNPETAEQFIDILIAEDVILRKKIADGHVDEKTMKRLERLTELRQKYMKYKEEQYQAKNAAENDVAPPKEKQVAEEKNCKPLTNAASPTNVTKHPKHIQYYKPLLLGMSRSVTSLSDPAFSNELKLHPLVKLN